MSKTQKRLLCYAMGISITLVITGFLEFGMRAFVTARVSNFLLFAALAIPVVTLPVYFLLRRPIVRSAVNHQPRSLPNDSFCIEPPKARTSLPEQGNAAVEIEHQGTQRSARFAPQKE
jgi:hypothetical protein